MCLSTVYKNNMTPETILMKNVMSIECRDGCVILTDLMEHQMAVEGTLEKGDVFKHDQNVFSADQRCF